jgi:hypothetical protein
LLAHGLWFSPASSTTKTGRYDIAESGAKTPKINQSINPSLCAFCPILRFYQKPDILTLIERTIFKMLLFILT